MKYYFSLSICCLLIIGCKKDTDKGLYLLEDLPSCDIPSGQTNIAPDYYIQEVEFNPKNSNQIIYIKSNPNLNEIRIVDLEKGTDTRIFSDSKNIKWLDWSAKNKILFSRDSFIYTMDVDGDDLKSIGFPFMPVLNPPSYSQHKAMWSTSGNEILTSYSEGEEHHMQIKNINNDEFLDAILPFPLPNDCIWFTANYAGLYFNSNTQTIQSLNLQSLTLENIGSYNEFPGRFDYHAASGTIVYIPWPLFENPNPIKSLNIHTGQGTQLSSTCANRNYRYVKISNDGKRIAAVCHYSEKVGESYEHKESIFIMDADGKNERRIKITE